MEVLKRRAGINIAATVALARVLTVPVIASGGITNIDDVNRRDEKNPLISRSLRKLTSTAQAYVTQLAKLKEQTKDPDEAAAIDRVADNANQIIEVGSKLPPATTESDKKKKKP